MISVVFVIISLVVIMSWNVRLGLLSRCSMKGGRLFGVLIRSLVRVFSSI